ncbi:MAG: Tn3 family transposase [Chloroflexi bacterium]|nr:Tn3 family transposase [Chloroflexota bacterium]
MLDEILANETELPILEHTTDTGRDATPGRQSQQEDGRLIKTLHILSWYESEEKRRWANRQLNKGEPVHSLKAYLSVGNRGILRRKTNEGLQHQVGCLNLLTNPIILWNSVYMAEALKQLEREGYALNSEDLRHIWPTQFEHVNVYGKYEFNLEAAQQRNGLRELSRPDALNP